jgi:hypothetical protein
LTVVLVLVSQPSAGLPLQSPKPGLQLATAQLPPAHAGVPFAMEQALPQAPQWPTVVLVLVSQPSAGLPLQLPKPGLQLATAQVPFTHAALPFAMEQAFPQAPQLLTSLPTLTSQPSATAPLQFTQPASQLAMLHVPLVHTGVPCGMLHTFPQAPQLLEFEAVPVSQPSAGLLLQSPVPGLQLAIWQLPPTHTEVPFATVQMRPQPPQSPRLVSVFVSQPSAGSPLQSAKPGAQLPMVQAPAVHSGVPFGELHVTPQLPQFASSSCVLTSQPSARFPLQSAKPGSQMPPHVPPLQSGTPLGTSWHGCPQAPQ